MGWTKFDLMAYESRNAPKHRQGEPLVGCEDESKLHQSIIDYCNSQWPKWKVIHARIDRKSSIPVGAHDLTVFMPNGRTVCFECKTRTGKISSEQFAWCFEMQKIGHEIYVIRSFEEFLNRINQPQNEKTKE